VKSSCTVKNTANVIQTFDIFVVKYPSLIFILCGDACDLVSDVGLFHKLIFAMTNCNMHTAVAVYDISGLRQR